MNSKVRGLAGRAFTIAATTAMLSGAAFGLASRSAGASEIAVSDVGVAISGPQTAVTNGLDALIKATVHNDGLLAGQSVVLTVATGGRVDPLLALPANCRVTHGVSTDTVGCAYKSIPARTTAAPVQIAVTTPATGTSMISNASVSTTSPSVVIGDTDKTAAWKTKLSASAPCGTSCTEAFVPEGGTVSRSATLPSGAKITQTFSVPAGATWTGGGVLVVLDEVDTTAQGITCGGSPCDEGSGNPNHAGEAKFTPDSSQTPVASEPLSYEVTYGSEDICQPSGASRLAGSGSDSDTGASAAAVRSTDSSTVCPPIYGLKSPATTGDASALTSCSPSSSASPDPCVAGETVSDPDGMDDAAGVFDSVTYSVNALKDLTLPLLSGLAL